MSEKQMLSVLRHKDIKPQDWKAEGPGGKKYAVIAHKREFIGEALNCGRITFEIQEEGADETEILVGCLGSVNEEDDGMTPDGTEKITRNETELPGGNIDGGVAGTPVLRGFPPRLRLKGNVIVKFQYEDPAEEDETAEYRFEGKFGEIRL